ncbi:PLP-dependent aminotransferase family protein [Clostridiaceae bacterium M8S5]|nr:PLP-dependent aminotransferase family protein [Clostridiaceae bacterium M8S5]
MDISKMIINKKLNKKSPLYMQIAKIIIDKIDDSFLKEGDKLPSERELATLFKVSRTTTINAYRYLEKNGYVNTKTGSGTYVIKENNQKNQLKHKIQWDEFFRPYGQLSMSSLMTEIINSSMMLDRISLDAGMPDPELYPLDKFKQLFCENMKYFKGQDFGYMSIEGLSGLRQNIAQMLVEKQIKAKYDNIMITSGSQQGIYLISKVLIEPGDYVVIEAPTYIGVIPVLKAAGARILSLPIKNESRLDILKDYIVRYRPKFIYTIPTYQNPSGNVMSKKQRKELIELAINNRLLIIEDDPYSDFYYDEKPPVSLKATSNYEGIIYISTFSKIIMPGLRLGYIVAHPTLISRVAMEKQYTDLHSNNLSQLLLNLYLKEGELTKHLEVVRKIYKKRRDIMARHITKSLNEYLDFSLPKGGFYIWGKILAPINSRKLLHEALNVGVSFIPGDAFYDIPTQGKELRLCFVSNSEDKIKESVVRLSRAFSSIIKKDRIINKDNNRPLI